ncbi:Bax inhibitor-1/YccA family protein [Rhabdothermincola salaria]|uniref:Bax inhibitor-1/YccA family protein n=1 Tax=Rhabdothermincola salaria TaxID=2903142 RepID=UPI001E4BD317|nr:Bax inhibitor-1/YccA family protein [Rhabdothermincola salaria]MCD9623314.1 Bax inhibitor-1/YccA family protein [Rhabdothermincola salaria]
MANPVLTPQRFEREGATGPGWASTAGPSSGAATQAAAGTKAAGGGRFGSIPDVPHDGPTMTLGGSMTAIGVLFAIILAAGSFGWMQVDQTSEARIDPETGQEVMVNTTSMPGWLLISVLVGLGLAILTIVKPKLSPFTAPAYALAYGVALGAISAVYNAEWNGIVVQAIGATLAVFFVMFFLYATRIIKVTKKYVAVVVAATLGIFVMYAVTWIATLFGADIMFWNEPSALGIGISVVIVIVAALNLGLDFAFIEQASKAGAPKYMEWFGAFGVTVTVVWLYLEILRLLSLLRQ